MNSFPAPTRGRGLAAAFAMEETFGGGQARRGHRALASLYKGRQDACDHHQNIDICTRRQASGR